MLKMPVLETRRMILRPASPALADAALEFYRRNAARLREVHHIVQNLQIFFHYDL